MEKKGKNSCMCIVSLFLFCQLHKIPFKNSYVVTVKNENGCNVGFFFNFGVCRETPEVMRHILCLGSFLP